MVRSGTGAGGRNFEETKEMVYHPRVLGVYVTYNQSKKSLRGISIKMVCI